jgi:hypothetical protein
MPSLLNDAPSLVAAVLLLTAFGLPGVAILGRYGRSELDPLERWVYGIPLGVVAVSLLLLLFASAIGLSLPLVLVVAAVAGGYGFWQLRWLERPRPAMGAFALIVLAVFALRFAIFWAGAYRYDDSGLHAANTGLWADWALHIGDVSSFVYGQNFPPQHPRYIGEPYAYHYLTSVTAAAMVKLGAKIPFSLALQSFLLTLLILLGVWAFARRITGRSGAAALAVSLFFLGGTLGWLLVARDLDATKQFWATIINSPWSHPAQEQANFRFQNLYFSLLQPQRSFLYGVPIALLVLSLLHAGVREGRRGAFILAGAVAGLLPFASLSTLLSLALITPFLFLLFPSRNWIAYFGLWTAVAAPQLWIQQGGGAGAASAFRVQLGWIAPPDPWIWFWLKNSGIFIPLLILALLDRSLLDRTGRRFLLAFMPAFALANIFVFQPWDWDNTKVLLYWYLGGAIAVSALLARAWTTRLAKVAVITALLTLTLSGLLVHLNQFLGRERTLLLTAEELEIARMVRERTAPGSVFAVGLQHNHPVPMLSGRKVLMSYPGWLWSQGYDYAARERDLREIFALAPRAQEHIQRYGIDYLVVGPWERSQFGAAPEMLRQHLRAVAESPAYSVFEVRRPSTVPERTGGR